MKPTIDLHSPLFIHSKTNFQSLSASPPLAWQSKLPASTYVSLHAPPTTSPLHPHLQEKHHIVLSQHKPHLLLQDLSNIFHVIHRFPSYPFHDFVQNAFLKSVCKTHPLHAVLLFSSSPSLHRTPEHIQVKRSPKALRQAARSQSYLSFLMQLYKISSPFSTLSYPARSPLPRTFLLYCCKTIDSPCDEDILLLRLLAQAVTDS